MVEKKVDTSCKWVKNKNYFICLTSEGHTEEWKVLRYIINKWVFKIQVSPESYACFSNNVLDNLHLNVNCGHYNLNVLFYFECSIY